MDDQRLLSGGYRLDESDSDVLVLRREDGSFVAAFSALGCTEGSVRRAMEEDRAKGERSHRLTAPVQHARTAAPEEVSGPARPGGL